MGRVAGIFPIPGMGEEFVVAEWEPDPQVIEAELLRMARRFGDWSEPLTEARQLMIESTEAHFDSESDPYGRKWIPLDPVYLAEKENAGEGDSILVRTGAMRDYATSEEAWIQTEDAIFFNAGGLPKDEKGFPYGVAHQSGSGESVTEFHRGSRTGEEMSIAKMQSLFRQGLQPGTGRGGNLPQRQFIGADEDTINEIEAVFLEHLEETVEFSAPLFGGGFAVRGAGGRFIGAG